MGRGDDELTQGCQGKVGALVLVIPDDRLGVAQANPLRWETQGKLCGRGQRMEGAGRESGLQVSTAAGKTPKETKGRQYQCGMA